MFLFYYSLQLSHKTTAVLIDSFSLSLHIFTLNMKSSNLIIVNIAVEKGGWCNGEYLLWLISFYHKAEQIQPNSEYFNSTQQVWWYWCSVGLPQPRPLIIKMPERVVLTLQRLYLNLHFSFQFTRTALLAICSAAATAHKLWDRYTSYNQLPKFMQGREEPSFCNTILHLKKPTSDGKPVPAQEVKSVRELML